MASSHTFTLDRIARIIFAVALIAVLVWLVGLLENVLLPFCLACLIAYMLEPLLELNRRWIRLKGRVIVTFVTLIEVTLVLGTLVYFFLPSVVDEVRQMGDIIRNASSHDPAVQASLVQLQEWIQEHLSFQALERTLEARQIEEIVQSGASMVSQSIDFVFHTLEWLITFIYVIFIMIDYPQLMRGFRRLVPPRYRPVLYRLSDDIKVSMNRYFRGQALIAACAAVFYCIGFSIVGIPLAIVLGLLVGILYMIPYFQYVTLIPVAVVCLIASLNGGGFWILMGECLLVYLVSQCICDYILTPKIMGKAMGLNPAIILLSLSVWGTLMGIIGMIIALPLTTLLLSYYREIVIDGKIPELVRKIN